MLYVDVCVNNPPRPSSSKMGIIEFFHVDCNLFQFFPICVQP